MKRIEWEGFVILSLIMVLCTKRVLRIEMKNRRHSNKDKDEE